MATDDPILEEEIVQPTVFVPGLPVPRMDIRLLERGDALLDIYDRNQKGRRGYGESITDVSAADLPVVGDVIGVVMPIAEMRKLPSVIQRLQKNEYVSDQELLDLHLYLKDQERRSQATWQGMAGDITRQMPGFMAEIGIWTAVGSAAGSAVPGPGTAAGAVGGAVAGSFKWLGTKAARLLASNAAEKSVRMYLAKNLSKAVTSGTAAAMGEAARHFTGKGIPMTLAATAADELINAAAGAPFGETRSGVEYRMSQAFEGEDTESETFGVDDAAWMGLGVRATEMMSEFTGPMFSATLVGPAKAALAKGAKLGGTKAGLTMAKLLEESWGPWTGAGGRKAAMEALGDSAPDLLKQHKYIAYTGALLGKLAAKYDLDPTRALKVLQKYGYDGVAEEMMEERFNGFAQGLLGISGDEASLKSAWDQMWPTVDQFKAELLSFSTPLILVGGATRAQAALTGRGSELVKQARHMADLLSAQKSEGPFEASTQTDGALAEIHQMVKEHAVDEMSFGGKVALYGLNMLKFLATMDVNYLQYANLGPGQVLDHMLREDGKMAVVAGYRSVYNARKAALAADGSKTQEAVDAESTLAADTVMRSVIERVREKTQLLPKEASAIIANDKLSPEQQVDELNKYHAEMGDRSPFEQISYPNGVKVLSIKGSMTPETAVTGLTDPVRQELVKTAVGKALPILYKHGVPVNITADQAKSRRFFDTELPKLRVTDFDLDRYARGEFDEMTIRMMHADPRFDPRRKDSYSRFSKYLGALRNISGLSQDIYYEQGDNVFIAKAVNTDTSARRYRPYKVNPDGTETELAAANGAMVGSGVGAIESELAQYLPQGACRMGSPIGTDFWFGPVLTIQGDAADMLSIDFVKSYPTYPGRDASKKDIQNFLEKDLRMLVTEGRDAKGNISRRYTTTPGALNRLVPQSDGTFRRQVYVGLRNDAAYSALEDIGEQALNLAARENGGVTPPVVTAFLRGLRADLEAIPVVTRTPSLSRLMAFVKAEGGEKEVPMKLLGHGYLGWGLDSRMPYARDIWENRDVVMRAPGFSEFVKFMADQLGMPAGLMPAKLGNPDAEQAANIANIMKAAAAREEKTKAAERKAEAAKKAADEAERAEAAGEDNVPMNWGADAPSGTDLLKVDHNKGNVSEAAVDVVPVAAMDSVKADVVAAPPAPNPEASAPVVEAERAAEEPVVEADSLLYDTALAIPVGGLLNPAEDMGALLDRLEDLSQEFLSAQEDDTDEEGEPTGADVEVPWLADDPAWKFYGMTAPARELYLRHKALIDEVMTSDFFTDSYFSDIAEPAEEGSEETVWEPETESSIEDVLEWLSRSPELLRQYRREKAYEAELNAKRSALKPLTDVSNKPTSEGAAVAGRAPKQRKSDENLGASIADSESFLAQLPQIRRIVGGDQDPIAAQVLGYLEAELQSADPMRRGSAHNRFTQGGTAELVANEDQEGLRSWVTDLADVLRDETSIVDPVAEQAGDEGTEPDAPAAEVPNNNPANEHDSEMRVNATLTNMVKLLYPGASPAEIRLMRQMMFEVAPYLYKLVSLSPKERIEALDDPKKFVDPTDLLLWPSHYVTMLRDIAARFRDTPEKLDAEVFISAGAVFGSLDKDAKFVRMVDGRLSQATAPVRGNLLSQVWTALSRAFAPVGALEGSNWKANVTTARNKIGVLGFSDAKSLVSGAPRMAELLEMLETTFGVPQWLLLAQKKYGTAGVVSSALAQLSRILYGPTGLLASMSDEALAKHGEDERGFREWEAGVVSSVFESGEKLQLAYTMATNIDRAAIPSGVAVLFKGKPPASIDVKKMERQYDIMTQVSWVRAPSGKGVPRGPQSAMTPTLKKVQEELGIKVEDQGTHVVLGTVVKHRDPESGEESQDNTDGRDMSVSQILEFQRVAYQRGTSGAYLTLLGPFGAKRTLLAAMLPKRTLAGLRAAVGPGSAYAKYYASLPEAVRAERYPFMTSPEALLKRIDGITAAKENAGRLAIELAKKRVARTKETNKVAAKKLDADIRLMTSNLELANTEAADAPMEIDTEINRFLVYSRILGNPNGFKNTADMMKRLEPMATPTVAPDVRLVGKSTMKVMTLVDPGMVVTLPGTQKTAEIKATTDGLEVFTDDGAAAMLRGLGKPLSVGDLNSGKFLTVLPPKDASGYAMLHKSSTALLRNLAVDSEYFRDLLRAIEAMPADQRPDKIVFVSADKIKDPGRSPIPAATREGAGPYVFDLTKATVSEIPFDSMRWIFDSSKEAPTEVKTDAYPVQFEGLFRSLGPEFLDGIRPMLSEFKQHFDRVWERWNKKLYASASFITNMLAPLKGKQVSDPIVKAVAEGQRWLNPLDLPKVVDTLLSRINRSVRFTGPLQYEVDSPSPDESLRRATRKTIDSEGRLVDVADGTPIGPGHLVSSADIAGNFPDTYLPGERKPGFDSAPTEADALRKTALYALQNPGVMQDYLLVTTPDGRQSPDAVLLRNRLASGEPVSLQEISKHVMIQDFDLVPKKAGFGVVIRGSGLFTMRVPSPGGPTMLFARVAARKAGGVSQISMHPFHTFIRGGDFDVDKTFVMAPYTYRKGAKRSGRNEGDFVDFEDGQQGLVNRFWARMRTHWSTDPNAYQTQVSPTVSDTYDAQVEKYRVAKRESMLSIPGALRDRSDLQAGDDSLGRTAAFIRVMHYAISARLQLQPKGIRRTLAEALTKPENQDQAEHQNYYTLHEGGRVVQFKYGGKTIDVGMPAGFYENLPLIHILDHMNTVLQLPADEVKLRKLEALFNVDTMSYANMLMIMNPAWATPGEKTREDVSRRFEEVLEFLKTPSIENAPRKENGKLNRREAQALVRMLDAMNGNWVSLLQFVNLPRKRFPGVLGMDKVIDAVRAARRNEGMFDTAAAFFTQGEDGLVFNEVLPSHSAFVRIYRDFMNLLPHFTPMFQSAWRKIDAALRVELKTWGRGYRYSPAYEATAGRFETGVLGYTLLGVVDPGNESIDKVNERVAAYLKVDPKNRWLHLFRVDPSGRVNLLPAYKDMNNELELERMLPGAQADFSEMPPKIQDDFATLTVRRPMGLGAPITTGNWYSLLPHGWFNRHAQALYDKVATYEQVTEEEVDRAVRYVRTGKRPTTAEVAAAPVAAAADLLADDAGAQDIGDSEIPAGTTTELMQILEAQAAAEAEEREGSPAPQASIANTEAPTAEQSVNRRLAFLTKLGFDASKVSGDEMLEGSFTSTELANALPSMADYYDSVRSNAVAEFLRALVSQNDLVALFPDIQMYPDTLAPAGRDNQNVLRGEATEAHIWIYSPAFSGSEAKLANTIVHELLHSLTLGPLSQVPGFKEEMERLLQMARDSVAGTPSAGLYGLKNVMEFISEAFSDATFQKVLASIPVTSVEGVPGTAWQRFVKAISTAVEKFLRSHGVPAQPTVLDAAVSAILRAIETGRTLPKAATPAPAQAPTALPDRMPAPPAAAPSPMPQASIAAAPSPGPVTANTPPSLVITRAINEEVKNIRNRYYTSQKGQADAKVREFTDTVWNRAGKDYVTAVTAQDFERASNVIDQLPDLSEDRKIDYRGVKRDMSRRLMNSMLAASQPQASVAPVEMPVTNRTAEKMTRGLGLTSEQAAAMQPAIEAVQPAPAAGTIPALPVAQVAASLNRMLGDVDPADPRLNDPEIQAYASIADTKEWYDMLVSPAYRVGVPKLHAELRKITANLHAIRSAVGEHYAFFYGFMGLDNEDGLIPKVTPYKDKDGVTRYRLERTYGGLKAAGKLSETERRYIRLVDNAARLALEKYVRGTTVADAFAMTFVDMGPLADGLERKDFDTKNLESFIPKPLLERWKRRYDELVKRHSSAAIHFAAGKMAPAEQSEFLVEDVPNGRPTLISLTDYLHRANLLWQTQAVGEPPAYVLPASWIREWWQSKDSTAHQKLMAAGRPKAAGKDPAVQRVATLVASLDPHDWTQAANLLYDDMYRRIQTFAGFLDTEDSRYLWYRPGYTQHMFGLGFGTAEKEAAKQLKHAMLEVKKERHEKLLDEMIENLRRAAVRRAGTRGGADVLDNIERAYSIKDASDKAIRAYMSLLGLPFVSREDAMATLQKRGWGLDMPYADLLRDIHRLLVQRLTARQLKLEALDAPMTPEIPDPLGLLTGMEKLVTRFKDREASGRTRKRSYNSYWEAFVGAGLRHADMGAVDAANRYAGDVLTSTVNKVLLSQMVLQLDPVGRPLIVAAPDLLHSGEGVLSDTVWNELLTRTVRGFGLKAPSANLPVKAQMREAVDQLRAELEANYTRVKSPYGSISEFYTRKHATPEESILDVMVGGEVAGLLKHLVGSDVEWNFGGVDWLKVMSKVNFFMKMGAMIFSLFFPIAGLESVQMMTRGSLWNPKNWYAKDRLSLNEIRRLLRTNDPYIHDILYAMRVSGIAVSDIHSTPIDLPLGAMEKDFAGAVDWIERNMGKAASGFARRVFSIPSAQSDVVFGTIFNTFKMYVTMWMVNNLDGKKRPNGEKIPHEEMTAALKKWADTINAGVGGFVSERYTYITPGMRQFLNMALFSYQWTMSAWNQAGGGILTGPLLHNQITEPEAAYTFGQMWPSTFLHVVMLPPFLLQLGAWLLFSAGDDDDQRTKFDMPFTWQNEAGREWFADMTPLMRQMPWYDGDPTGDRRQYLRFGKQVYEIARWLEDPIKNAVGKMSQEARLAFELATGTSPGGEWDLSFKNEGLIGWFYTREDGFWGSRAGYVVQKVMPFSVLAWAQNPDAAPLQFVGPVSKGMSQTRAVNDLAAILSAWANEYKGPDGWPEHVKRNLKALGPEILDAAARNGYDPKKVLESARGLILRDLYTEFYQAFEKQDQDAMTEAGRKILRVNGTIDGIRKSVRNKDGMYGKTGTRTPEQMQMLASAFKRRSS